jgi:glycosidase
MRALILTCSALLLAGCVTVDTEMPHESLVDDWRDEVIYQVMVDRFDDGDPNNNYNVDYRREASYHGGDWQGVIDRLDYIEALGVTALWISPVVKNVESDAGFASYHGYWTQDFVAVNQHFGDLTKLQELVRAAHARDIKVILDVVTNHVGQLFYYDINRNGDPDTVFFGGGGPGSGSQNPDYPSDLRRSSEWDPDYDRRGVQGFTSLGENGPAPIEWIEMPEINRVPPNPPAFRNPLFYNRRGRVTVWDHAATAAISCTDSAQCDWSDRCTQTGACDFYCGDGTCQPTRDYVREQEIKGDFPGGLKDLDTSRQDVTDALIEVFQYWIEVADFDGFRIDTLKHQEHAFFEQFAPAMRSYAKRLGKDNFLIFGEAFDGDDALLGSYTQGEGVDSVFYFSYKYRVFDNVFGRGAPCDKQPWEEVASCAPYQAQLMYDERSAQDVPGQPRYSQTPKTNGTIDAEGAPVNTPQLLVSFLDNHDVPRFLYQHRDVALLHSALNHQLTLDGIPCIYYGTEHAFAGGPDPSNREDMWLSGFRQDGATFKHMQKLLRLRRTLAPLRRGDLTYVWATKHVNDEPDAGIMAYERSYKDETALVILNTHREQASSTHDAMGTMPVSFAPGSVLVDTFDANNPSYTVSADGTLDVEVPALGIRILIPR